MFISEKPIILVNKSQFCAFEMENNGINLFNSSSVKTALYKNGVQFSPAKLLVLALTLVEHISHCLGTLSSKSS